MNKYTYLLVFSACMIAQAAVATVKLDIKVDGETQSIILAQDQQELCVFENTRIAILNKEEHENSAVLEIATDKHGEIRAGEITIEFAKNTAIEFEPTENTSSGIEILAIKQ